MFLEGEQEPEEQNEIEELKTFTISDYVKLKREQSKKRKEKLKVLQDRTDKLKKELGYE